MIGRKTKKYEKLKQKLNYHYRYFDKDKISPDPLEFPHRFNNYYDIESSAFISSIFAFGSIGLIINILEKLHEIMGHSPYEFIIKYNYTEENHPFIGMHYRFFKPNDIHLLFKVLNMVYVNYGDLLKLFLMEYFASEKNIKLSLNSFSKNLLHLWSHFGEITTGAKFMFPLPERGGTCKRMNLFLRWMVRNDELDFGLWKDISPDKLVIPVDTHIARICKELKLTKLKNPNWKMAEEITDNLKVFNENDPVKYDFAICHIGMRKLKF